MKEKKIFEVFSKSSKMPPVENIGTKLDTSSLVSSSKSSRRRHAGGSLSGSLCGGSQNLIPGSKSNGSLTNSHGGSAPRLCTSSSKSSSELEGLRCALQDRDTVIQSLRAQLGVHPSVPTFTSSSAAGSQKKQQKNHDLLNQQRHQSNQQMNDAERVMAKRRVSTLKMEADRKREAIAELKKALRKLDVTDNIDIRIKQAELEYALGREELDLLSISEEMRTLQSRIEQSQGPPEQKKTIFSWLKTGIQLTLVAVNVSCDPSRPRWGVTFNNNNNKDGANWGLYIDWAAEGEPLRKGDRLLEVNGKILGTSRNTSQSSTLDELSRLLAVSYDPAEVVVLRPRRSHHGQSHHSSDVNSYNTVSSSSNSANRRLKADNLRLSHRICYLEEQVRELQAKEQHITSINITDNADITNCTEKAVTEIPDVKNIVDNNPCKDSNYDNNQMVQNAVNNYNSMLSDTTSGTNVTKIHEEENNIEKSNITKDNGEKNQMQYNSENKSLSDNTNQENVISSLINQVNASTNRTLNESYNSNTNYNSDIENVKHANHINEINIDNRNSESRDTNQLNARICFEQKNMQVESLNQTNQKNEHLSVECVKTNYYTNDTYKSNSNGICNNYRNINHNNMYTNTNHSSNANQTNVSTPYRNTNLDNKSIDQVNSMNQTGELVNLCNDNFKIKPTTNDQTNQNSMNSTHRNTNGDHLNLKSELINQNFRNSTNNTSLPNNSYNSNSIDNSKTSIYNSTSDKVFESSNLKNETLKSNTTVHSNYITQNISDTSETVEVFRRGSQVATLLRGKIVKHHQPMEVVKNDLYHRSQNYQQTNQSYQQTNGQNSGYQSNNELTPWRKNTYDSRSINSDARSDSRCSLNSVKDFEKTNGYASNHLNTRDNVYSNQEERINKLKTEIYQNNSHLNSTQNLNNQNDEFSQTLDFGKENYIQNNADLENRQAEMQNNDLPNVCENTENSGKLRSLGADMQYDGSRMTNIRTSPVRPERPEVRRRSRTKQLFNYSSSRSAENEPISVPVNSMDNRKIIDMRFNKPDNENTENLIDRWDERSSKSLEFERCSANGMRPTPPKKPLRLSLHRARSLQTVQAPGTPDQQNTVTDLYSKVDSKRPSKRTHNLAKRVLHQHIL